MGLVVGRPIPPHCLGSDISGIEAGARCHPQHRLARPDRPVPSAGHRSAPFLDCHLRSWRGDRLAGLCLAKAAARSECAHRHAHPVEPVGSVAHTPLLLHVPDQRASGARHWAAGWSDCLHLDLQQHRRQRFDDDHLARPVQLHHRLQRVQDECVGGGDQYPGDDLGGDHHLSFQARPTGACRENRDRGPFSLDPAIESGFPAKANPNPGRFTLTWRTATSPTPAPASISQGHREVSAGSLAKGYRFHRTTARQLGNFECRATRR